MDSSHSFSYLADDPLGCLGVSAADLALAASQSGRPSIRIAEIAASAGTGINPLTGLATDFLNQFNEVVMLLDMVQDEPELLEDISEWHANDYVAHFENSRLVDRELVLEAYELSPRLTRARFDAMCDELVALLTTGVAFLGHCQLAGGHALMAPAAATLAAEARNYLERLNAFVHAGNAKPAQSTVDKMFRAARA